MITKERQLQIVKIVLQRGAVSVPDLSEMFATSPSTIRRDLAKLDEEGKLIKVFGGATSLLKSPPRSEEDPMEVKHGRNMEAKAAVARVAVSLIKTKDMVYIDAGSTTELMADYIEDVSCTYVTNSIPLGTKLARRGFAVRILGGLIKASTEAVIGGDARNALRRYNFNIGFFGTNGISLRTGFTTPDLDEAEGKRMAMEHCKRSVVVTDSSKFDRVSGITFADLQDAEIITNKIEHTYARLYAKKTPLTEV